MQTENFSAGIIKQNDVKLPGVHPQVNLSIAKVEVMTQEPVKSKQRVFLKQDLQNGVFYDKCNNCLNDKLQVLKK